MTRVKKVTGDDCQSCGACCATGQLVEIGHRDRRRLGARVKVDVVGDKKTAGFKQVLRAIIRLGGGDVLARIRLSMGAWTGAMLMPKRPGTLRCAQLRGRVGRDVSCAVYKNRPTVCRQFRPGSGECLEIRGLMGVSK